MEKLIAKASENVEKYVEKYPSLAWLAIIAVVVGYFVIEKKSQKVRGIEQKSEK